MAAPLQAVVSAETRLLPEARTWWCLITYQLVSGKDTYPEMALGPVDRFVSSLAKVSQEHLRNVRMGRSHLSPAALARLDAGLGPRAEFLRNSVLSSSFEEGVREYAYYRRLDRESARLRERHQRRRGL